MKRYVNLDFINPNFATVGTMNILAAIGIFAYMTISIQPQFEAFGDRGGVAVTITQN